MVWCVKHQRYLNGHNAKVGTPRKRGPCTACRYKEEDGTMGPPLIRMPNGSLLCRHNLTTEQIKDMWMGVIDRVLAEAGV